MIADHDQLAIFRQRQCRHDGVGQIHLGRFVQHQALHEFVTKEPLLALLVIHHAVDGARRCRHDCPPLGLDAVNRLRRALFPITVAGNRRDPRQHRAARPVPEKRDIEQPVVEVPLEQIRVLVPPASEGGDGVVDIVQQHIDRGVGLARNQDAELGVRHQGTLQPRQQGKGGRVTLASAGRSLHQQQRIERVVADEAPFAGLEPKPVVECGKGVETLQEPLLPVDKRGRMGHVGPGLLGQEPVEAVPAGLLDQPCGHLVRPIPGEVVRIFIQGQQHPGFEWSVVAGEAERPHMRVSPTTPIEIDHGPGPHDPAKLLLGVPANQRRPA